MGEGEGGFYRTEDGTVKGPMEYVPGNGTSAVFGWAKEAGRYYPDGTPAWTGNARLVEEVKDPNEIPRRIPRMDDAGIVKWADEAAAPGEPRSLSVGIWCGELGLLVADVTVATDAVEITSAIFDGEENTVAVTSDTLDRVALRRKSGEFVPLRQLVEARAREEAFA